MDSADDTPQARFGAELRGLRLRAGLSVRRLADELHRAHSGIVEYERGTRLPGVEVVEQYEDYFELARGTLVVQRERARVEALEHPRDGTLDEHLGDVVCPYKGLRPFESEDAGLFFGREGQVEDVLTRLAEARFVAVVGASGSGKSSFVRAGLLAAMRRAPAGACAQVALLTPGTHPLDALASAVSAAIGGAVHVTADDLRADPDALAGAAAHASLVIAVDQFEELFTLCADEEERRCFVEALIGAWRDLTSPVLVTLALRADFYGRVAAYPELAAAVVAHQALIGPMGTADLRRAIELPAANCGLLLQPGLVETMLEDLAGEPGSLPLLSHALLETWKRRQRLQLTVGGYRGAGGVRGAIAQTAELTLQALPEADRTIARSIFLSLTDINEGAEPTGRRVDRTELAGQPGSGDRLERVLGVLADARLVSVDEDTVVVAHEALIRHWPRLRGWIEADRAGLLVQRRLQVAAREWDGLARDPGAAYRGARLAVAQEWASEHPDHLSALDRDFLAASQATEQHTTRRRRLLLGAVTAALGVSVVLGVVAYLQGRSARSQAFAARAIDAAKSDPEQGLRLALKAAELGHGSLVERALRETVAAAGWTRILRGRRRLAHNDVAFSPNARLAVTGGDDATATIWEVRSGRRVTTLRHGGPIRSVRFSADGSHIATASDDGVARLWDVAGRLVRELRPRGGGVRSAVFDQDGARVITATAGGAVQVWDLSRAAPPLRLATGADRPLDVTSFSPDGTQALTAGPPGELRVWTLTARPRFEVLRFESDTTASATVATFSPDGSRVLAGDALGRVCVWSLRDGTRSCHAQANTITDVNFSADGDLFVTASVDGTAEIRRTDGDRRVARLPHDGPVNTASFSPDGDRVLTAGDDRVARLWGTDGRREGVLRGHTDTIAVARFSANGAQVLTGSDDGSARVWPARPDVGTLPGHAMPGADLAFSPNSRLLLAVDVAGTAAIWDLRRGMRIEPRGAIVANDSGLLPCDRFTGCGPWSPDSRSVAGANADYEASIWDADTGAAHALGVSDATGAAFDPDGARLAIVRLHGPALAVDRAGRRLASVPRGSRSQVSSASFVQDARHILTVDVDRKVALSDAARGTPAGPQASATLGGIGAAALSRDGSRLAIGTPAGVLQVHDTGSRRMRATAPQGRAISGVAFDRDGARIVTAHEDGSARIWNAASLGDPPVVLGGHSAPLLGAEFSPDGRLVLTAGTDGTARLWDAVLGTNILVLSTSDDGRARFSPDGRLIAIGGRRTVEVHTCELCERFDGLVRSARARLPQG